MFVCMLTVDSSRRSVIYSEGYIYLPHDGALAATCAVEGWTREYTPIEFEKTFGFCITAFLLGAVVGVLFDTMVPTFAGRCARGFWGCLRTRVP